MKFRWLALLIILATCFTLAQQESGTAPAASPTPRKKIRVSAGVIRGQVLKKVLPDAADLKSLKNSEVKITFLVDPTGKVELAEGAGGDPALYDRSIQAIKEWRFRPWVVNGERIYLDSYVYFRFNKGKASALFHD
jgi:protein TonB